MLAMAVLCWTPLAEAMSLSRNDRNGTLNVRKGFRYTAFELEGNSTLFSGASRLSRPAAGSDAESFQQTLKVDVDMEVLPRLSVRGRFDDTLFPAKQNLAVEYRGDALTVLAGDIMAGFAGVEFPMESQSLFGARARYVNGRHAVTGVAAGLAGASGHFEGRGDFTRGPFFMPNPRVINGSERVLVDGARRFRGTDYEFDYATGVLTFKDPVDDRFKIIVDYDYESPTALGGQYLLASRYTGELSETTNLGFSVGTRAPGTDVERTVLGFDGNVSLGKSTSLGGELAMGGSDAADGMALRTEAGGSVKGVGWTAALRRVDPTFTGLGSTASRKDYQETSLGLNKQVAKGARVNTRLYHTRDNLDDDPSRPVVTDTVQENGLVYQVPRNTRLELTLDNRNELHADDLEVHMLDRRETSARVGARYRLDRHMVRSSFEVRRGWDLTGSSAERGAHVLNTQLQSRLTDGLFGSTTLQLSRSFEPPTGVELSKELLAGAELSLTSFKHLGTNASYTLQDREGAGASRTHSGTFSVRAQNMGALLAETSLQLKRTIPKDGITVGDAILSGRAGYSWGARGNVTMDYQHRLNRTSRIGPVTMDCRGSFRPRKEWEMGLGYRLDWLEDKVDPTQSYNGRMVYSEATIEF